MKHGETLLPAFMPVATQASMRGVTYSQVEKLEPPITLILNNTYHLGARPGTDVLDAAGGAHTFQDWPRNMLTDSGGFQMVSLASLSKVTEEGVEFTDPHDPSSNVLLTPEKSMAIQHSIGSDIMMQLDDVIPSLSTGPRVEEAMHRSARWLARALDYHKAQTRDKDQNLFPIVQGGLDYALREKSIEYMLERDPDIPGYAIGGLSGGEEKDIFWRVVLHSADRLPFAKPRYTMGVGYAEDLLVCIALGIDMADCVYPTRTARFGVALNRTGNIDVARRDMATDFRVVDETCPCPTCERGDGMSRAVLHAMIRGRDAAAASALTLHNLVFQSRLMHGARDAIVRDEFPQYLKDFFHDYFKSRDNYPQWAVNALAHVGVDL